MPQTLEGSLPGVPITDGQQVVLEARDPATGNAVTGVTVSAVSIYGLDLSATDQTPALVGPLMYVPSPTG